MTIATRTCATLVLALLASAVASAADIPFLTGRVVDNARSF